jgi:hypothetical protein
VPHRNQSSRGPKILDLEVNAKVIARFACQFALNPVAAALCRRRPVLFPGSARASRAGDGALAIALFIQIGYCTGRAPRAAKYFAMSCEAKVTATIRIIQRNMLLNRAW